MLLLFHGETKSSVEIQATKLTCAQQVREWAPFHFSFVCGMKDKPPCQIYKGFLKRHDTQ